MEKLNVKTKEGKCVYKNCGFIYVETEESIYDPITISEMIKLLSHNKIYPKIKFDRQFELIYDSKNNYVIASTIHKAFCDLIITLFN